MRIIFATALSLLVVPARADMDPYTRWLSSRPLTRLDWMVSNGTRRMNDLFVDRSPQSETFLSVMQQQGVTPQHVNLAFDPRTDAISLFFAGVTRADRPDSGDCVKALGTVRDYLLIVGQHEAGAVDLKSQESRKRLAAGVMGDFAGAPSGMEYADAPKNLTYALAAIARVEVLLFGAEFKSSASCTGTLSGTDFKEKN